MALQKHGCSVDALNLSDWEETIRQLQQGEYSVVVTEPNGAALPEGKCTFTYINELRPETRRRFFLALVGDDFRTGDGTQAFVATAAVVINSKELGSASTLLPRMMAERDRFFKCMLDAQESLGEV